MEENRRIINVRRHARSATRVRNHQRDGRNVASHNRSGSTVTEHYRSINHPNQTPPSRPHPRQPQDNDQNPTMLFDDILQYTQRAFELISIINSAAQLGNRLMNFLMMMNPNDEPNQNEED